MVTAHTREQYRQIAPISYSVAWISQCTKSSAKSIPALNVSQYHLGRITFASKSAPRFATSAYATRPRNGFGNPKTRPSGEDMTGPQAIIGLMLHSGLKLGFSRIFMRSIESMNAANTPRTPPIKRSIGYAFFSVHDSTFFVLAFAIRVIIPDKNIRKEQLLPTRLL